MNFTAAERSPQTSRTPGVSQGAVGSSEDAGIWLQTDEGQIKTRRGGGTAELEAEVSVSLEEIAAGVQKPRVGNSEQSC